MFFNNQAATNDINGTLHGNVVFAQATTFPSRPATDPKDIRPHLVSLRDTLVLFKPLNDTFDSEASMKMSVFNQDDNLVYEQPMLPPDQLPPIAGRFGDLGDEFVFIEPDSYDVVVDGIIEFNGGHELLMDHEKIKVQVSDDGWIENVYLADISKSNGTLTMITFSSTSSKPFSVNYGDNKLKLKPNGKMVFTNLNGKWENMYASAYVNHDAVRKFIINNKGPLKVIENRKLVTNLEKDNNGSGIANFLREYGNIHVVKGAWDGHPKAVYLPQNDTDLDKKIVVFTTTYKNRKKTTNIYYGEGKIGQTKINIKAKLTGRGKSEKQNLKKVDTLIFINRNGKWLEWSDALSGAIQYGDNFWSARIPKTHVKPGMSLTFENGEAIGSIPEVEVGAPTELVLHTVDIGMLVEPRGMLNFSNNTECQNSYYQTLPVSRLIVTEYEPVHFKEIVLSDNTTYVTHSTDEGGAYKGDMRAEIGKALISAGINMANYGIHSTFGPSGAKRISPYYRTTNWFTIHNSRGNYSNGIKNHGLSGGATVVTIFQTCNPNTNEQSHEIGHNWAGHWPNGFSGSVHRPSEYFGSSWGWNSDLNLFLPNFHRLVTGERACVSIKENKRTKVDAYRKCQESFFGHKFGRDAMAGGSGAMYPSVSYFTMHTPFVMYKIQNGHGIWERMEGEGLERYANWDKSSNTGLVKWDPNCKCMKPWIVKPEESEAKDPSTDSNNYEDLPRKPVKQGVAVATIVGFYDPELTMRTYIYPAMHGSYGNVFASNSEDEINNLSEKGCYAAFTNANGDEQKFVLKDVRQAGENEAGETGKNMNKFHINIAETFEPTLAKIYCRGQIIAQRGIKKSTRTLNYNVYGNQL